MYRDLRLQRLQADLQSRPFRETYPAFKYLMETRTKRETLQAQFDPKGWVVDVRKPTVLRPRSLKRSVRLQGRNGLALLSFCPKGIFEDFEITCETGLKGKTPRKEVMSTANWIFGPLASDIDGERREVSKSTKEALDHRWMLQTETVLIVVQAQQTWREAVVTVRMCWPGAFDPQLDRHHDLSDLFGYD